MYGLCVCSEFSDIFDLDHFKNVLGNDVRIVSSLPSTHVMTRPVEEKRTPLHASPEWIRSFHQKGEKKFKSRKVLEFLPLEKFKSNLKNGMQEKDGDHNIFLVRP